MRQRIRNARGLTLVGLWAFAPAIVVQSDGEGGFEISVGASAGQYEVVSRSCAGDFLSSRGVPVYTGGILVEYEPSAPFRFAGFGGVTSTDGEARDASGPFVGALVAWEARQIGVGIGPVLVPTNGVGFLESPDPAQPPTLVEVSGSQVLPSAYLRLGDRAGGFFQADFLAPSPIPGATGLLRTGVGFHRDRTSGFFGVSWGRAFDVREETMDNGGPFGELTFRLGQNWSGLVAGSWHVSEELSDWGAGIGLRYRPGR